MYMNFSVNGHYGKKVVGRVFPRIALDAHLNGERVHASVSKMLLEDPRDWFSIAVFIKVRLCCTYTPIAIAQENKENLYLHQYRG